MSCWAWAVKFTAWFSCMMGWVTSALASFDDCFVRLCRLRFVATVIGYC